LQNGWLHKKLEDHWSSKTCLISITSGRDLSKRFQRPTGWKPYIRVSWTYIH